MTGEGVGAMEYLRLRNKGNTNNGRFASLSGERRGEWDVEMMRRLNVVAVIDTDERERVEKKEEWTASPYLLYSCRFGSARI